MNIRRLLLLMIGLFACGALFSILGGLLGARVLSPSDSTGWGGLVGAIAGLAVGYPFGVVIGLIVTRHVFHRSGSLWKGVLGAVLGLALTFGLAEPLKLNANPNLLLASFGVITPLLAAVGYSLGNRPR